MASDSDDFDTSFTDDFPSLHLDQDSSDGDGDGDISPSDLDDSDDDLPLARLTSNAATSWHGTPFRAVHRLDFVGAQPGPTTPMDAATTEIDFLQLFLPDDVLQDVVDETNRYASQRQRQSGRQDDQWTTLTLEELKAWLGLRIFMSVCVLPTIDMYWSQDWLYGNSYIPNVMLRNRFDKISQYLHVADVTDNPARGEPGAYTMENKIMRKLPTLHLMKYSMLLYFCYTCLVNHFLVFTLQVTTAWPTSDPCWRQFGDDAWIATTHTSTAAWTRRW